MTEHEDRAEERKPEGQTEQEQAPKVAALENPPATHPEAHADEEGEDRRSERGVKAFARRARRAEKAVRPRLEFLAILAAFMAIGVQYCTTMESLELTRQAVELSAASLAETRRSTLLSQRAFLWSVADADRAAEFSRSGLEETRESNELTASGLEFSRQALEVSERPWVVTIMAKQGVSTEEPNTLLVNMINTGRSPAIDFRAHSRGRLVSKLPMEFPILKLPSEAEAKTGSVSVLGPGQTYALRSRQRALTAEEKQAILDGTRTWVIFGNFQYRDGFGRERRGAFCYHTDHRDPDEWIYCPRHNHAD